MNEYLLLDGSEQSEEFPPDFPLVLDAIRPQAALNGFFAVSDAQSDEVVEIAVRQTFDIKIDRRAFGLQIWAADDVQFLLPNRQRFERVVILLAFVPLPLWPPPWRESTGKLGKRDAVVIVAFI